MSQFPSNAHVLLLDARKGTLLTTATGTAMTSRLRGISHAVAWAVHVGLVLGALTGIGAVASNDSHVTDLRASALATCA